jgi:hypothetical protein
MARRARLSCAGTSARLLAILAAVLLLHAFLLHWLAGQLEHPSALRPLPTPMFTRLLTPQPPAASPAQPAPAAARRQPRRPAVTSLASNASPPAPPASAAQAPAPPPVPQETEVAASTPASTATTATTAGGIPESVSAWGSGSPSAEANQPPPPALDKWPADTRVNYRLGGNFRGELHGTARVQWQRQDSQYQTRIDIDLTLLASLALTSQGEVTPQGLLPRVYEELRRSGPRTARLGDATITLNDGRTVPRPPGVQDTASQFVELSHRFASGRDVLEVGRSVSFWMARPGAVDFWTYDIVGREILRTPQLGEVETFRLKPRPIANPRGNITVEMWFAPSLQYLPVRIRVNMGESTYVDLMVLTIEQR